MKNILAITIFILAGCTNATEVEKECVFLFSSANKCSLNDTAVELVLKKIADDEKLIKSLKVSVNTKIQELKVSDDISILDGDKGLIVLQDINFDSYLDIAVSTSFGLPNLYMDYWVYDSNNKNFIYIGNYTRFTIDKKNKKLSNRVKINAAKYENQKHTWKGINLVKQN